MSTIAKIFDDECRRTVTAAVRDAESQTSAEIVPVVARQSARYERAEDLCGLILALLAATITWFCLDGVGAGSSGRLLELAGILLASIAGFTLGVILASQLPALRRPFVARARMEDAIIARATQTFVERRVHQTSGGTGLMVYISLFERGGTVLADQVVRDRLSDEAINEFSEVLAEGMRRGDPAAAMAKVIRDIGERLADVLPRYDDDVNELPDALVTLD
jgi:putative membrane protein